MFISPHCAVDEASADGRVARLSSRVGDVREPVGEEGGEGANPSATELVVGQRLEHAVHVEATLRVLEARSQLVQTARVPQGLCRLRLPEVAESGHHGLPDLTNVALRKNETKLQ